ncbi:hypothetical protein [Rhodocyclus gracilis]|uniref:Uncharacterized protein n=1 Tax=Rhodocyclus tenuis TaxID=1066 RepID=A0A6L5JVJ4_RHOTE|nr:hypothetical protein [Rhodocyclus gracilis]MQY50832.1 hypothetical protein [Rhodocyclus gracilis]
MQTYQQTLTAGQQWRLGVPGSYFRVLSLANPVSIIFMRHGSPAFTATNVLDGFWSQPDGGFDEVVITSATAQDVQVGITSGNAGYDRAAGSVAITNSTGNATQTTANVTNASTQILAAKPGRRYLMVQNNDAAGVVYLFFGAGPATAANGVKIAPGGSYVAEGWCPANAVQAIGSIASNANVVIVEG